MDEQQIDVYQVVHRSWLKATSPEEAAAKALAQLRSPNPANTVCRVFNENTGAETRERPVGAAEQDERSVDVYVGRSAGVDGAVLVIVDTVGFEPDGSGDGPAVRVLVNDGDVYEGVPFDQGDGAVEYPRGKAPDWHLSVPLAAIAYPDAAVEQD